MGTASPSRLKTVRMRSASEYLWSAEYTPMGMAMANARIVAGTSRIMLLRMSGRMSAVTLPLLVMLVPRLKCRTTLRSQ